MTLADAAKANFSLSDVVVMAMMYRSQSVGPLSTAHNGTFTTARCSWKDPPLRPAVDESGAASPLVLG
jgi:hypothetical protein